jgi:hypothetical protein
MGSDLEGGTGEIIRTCLLEIRLVWAVVPSKWACILSFAMPFLRFINTCKSPSPFISEFEKQKKN